MSLQILIILGILNIIEANVPCIKHTRSSRRNNGQENNVCLTKTCVKEAAVLLNTIDESVSPCDDFFHFSCGKWIQSLKLPESKSRVTRLSKLGDELNDKVQELIPKIDVKTEPQEFIKNVKNYYDSCVNTTRLEELGDKPLRDLIDQLGGWPLVSSENWKEVEWTDIYLKLRKLGLISSLFFSLSVDTDLKDSSKRIIIIDQPSYGLGNRDAVLKPANDPTIVAYKSLLTQSAQKLGAKQSSQWFRTNSVNSGVQEIFDFEVLMAQKSMAKELRRNKTAIYDKMTVKQLMAITPNINWLKIIKNDVSESVTEDEEIVLLDTPFIKALNDILSITNKKILANYMVWRVIESKMADLNEEWLQLKEQFYSAIFGTKGRTPRSEKCISSTKSSLDIAISYLYVKNFFKDEDKEKASEMFKNIVKQFRNGLETNTWMGETTRAEALGKVDKMELMIGYPKQLKDDSEIGKYYQNLRIDSSDYFGNNDRISKWFTDSAFSKLREPVDPNDWRDSGSIVQANAFYSALQNMAVVPAGVLQGVFYNKDRPNYLNYGAIGYIVGHEVSHGFDDYGKQYDEKGNLRNWWDSKTNDLYSEKAKCFINQYNNYTLKEIAQNLNGVNTQGENIADNGGVLQALGAYLKLVEDKGSESKLPGLDYTPEQLFWISSGGVWCAKQTNQFLKNQIIMDPHSPSIARVNLVASNSEKFAQAFNCPSGSPMNPTHKCSMW